MLLASGAAWWNVFRQPQLQPVAGRLEQVVFDEVTPEWRAFCTDALGFKVPDDLDLIVAARAAADDSATA